MNRSFSLPPAESVPFGELVEAFNAGYSGYVVPVQVTEIDLRHHIDAYKIDLSASRVALIENAVVGLVLLGVRGQQGWIGGLGIHPTYRRQGIGQALMRAAIAESQNRGLESVKLEVITTNNAAHQLYQQLGFVTLRRLLVLQRQPGPVNISESLDIHSVEAKDVQALYPRFHPKPTPWQRDLTSIEPSTQAWMIAAANQPAAYVIGFASASTVHILDLACASGHEAELGKLLMYLHEQNPDAIGRLVNLGEDEPSWPVLEALGWQEILSQYEMALLLTNA